MQRIKDRLPLLDYIKRFREMKASPKSKDEYFGKCISPAHEDDKPSFYVNTAKQIYSCHGCGISGNVCGAYAIINGMEDDDAKFALGRELGVFNERRLDDAESMLSRAAGKFAWQLARRDDAMAYLATRGINEETIKRFGIGFCWGREFQNLDQAQTRMAIATGLAREPSKDDPTKPVRSFMAGRITFPVKDRSGRVVGFAGRLVPGGFNTHGPKYMNSPETQWFHKSELLFGAHEAYAGISRCGYAVVVEGYMDVAMLHQFGVDNAVAVMGASANETTFQNLWAMTRRVVFCLDGDSAGDAGALRSVLAAAPSMPDGCEIAIARLPTGMDPDEYVLAHGEEAFRTLCEHATPLSRFLMESNLNGHDLSYPEGRARFLAEAQKLAANFVVAPLIQEQIVAEARAINAASLVDAALNVTGLGEGVSARELKDAIALMQRRLLKLEAEASGAPARPGAAAATPAAAPAPREQVAEPEPVQAQEPAAAQTPAAPVAARRVTSRYRI
ncbi:DNA primase [Paucibacter soli]|uniref:DNA primase n=1 Tax=Paucibacter soli TaxID=3133433 RepID=UPI00309F3DAF